MTTPTPRADAARPVPTDVLEKCARLLGDGYFVACNAVGECWLEHRTMPWLSGGNLLLAILNKAAEMGFSINLTVYDPYRSEAAMVNCDGASGEYNSGTPLSSLIYAFAQLEPPHDR